MPSSRKKNKGRDRKAKQAVKKEESEKVEVYNIWTRWARGNIGSSAGVIHSHCNHGLELKNITIPNISHPVSRLVTSIFMSGDLKGEVEVWNNNIHRKLAVDILISIGASWMLRSSIANDPHTVPIRIAQVIVMLENYAGDFDSTTWCRISAKKAVLFTFGGMCTRRDLLKLFRKRITCKCLKKMHLEARTTMPKMGKCHHCGVVKERELLMVCSRCMIDQYCSRKCQVTASPGHRTRCDVFYRAHQQTVANK